MKKFFFWLGLVTLTIALSLPFILGRLLADAYPSLLQQTLGRADSPARLDQLDFHAGWFGSEARWLVNLAGSVVEVDDRIQHFPLWEEAVLSGQLQVRDKTLDIHYSLGLDRNIHLQARLRPGQQGLALWQSGELEASLNPENGTGQAKGRLELVLLPGLQVKEAHMIGQWQRNHGQLALMADTLAHGPVEWTHPILGLETGQQPLTLRLKADRITTPGGQCQQLALEGRAEPREPAYWLRLTPLLGQMEQLDWLRFASETLPGLLAANPKLDIIEFELQCANLSPMRASLRLELRNMPPNQVLQTQAWLAHLQGEGWLEASPDDLRALGLPDELATVGRLEFRFSDGLVSVANQTFPLSLLIQGLIP